jgi:para-nitrobenzyl esterase
MADAWASFAATGDPATLALGEWPTYGEERATLLLDVDHRVELDPHAAERSVWYP